MSEGRGNIDEEAFSILGAAARDLARLKTIVTIIARHGFGEFLQRAPLGRFLFAKAGISPHEPQDERAHPALRFRRLLEALGPTYIKFGQILSMRPDVLPPEYIAALSNLQDGAPPVPLVAVKERILRGLGRPVEAIFAEFDDEPLATASIGQIHRARTWEGQYVVVKVQRPEIESVMRGDLDLLFLFAKMLEAGIEEMQLMQPSEFVAEFERALVRELDFTQELKNLLTAASHLDPERRVRVPRPLAHLSCRTVLTMELFSGTSVRHLEPGTELAKGAAHELLHCALKQVFVDGFFHGDPHAGNILANELGELCLIDFGLIGRLTEEQQADIVALIFAILTRDAARIAHHILKMGTPTARVNLAELKAEVTRLLGAYFSITQIAEFKSQEFSAAFVAAAQRFRIKMAPEYTILIKAVSTAEGVIRYLDPTIDVVAIGTPYVQRIMARRFSPSHLFAESWGGLSSLRTLLEQLPRQVEQIMHDAETGNIQVRAVTPQLDALVPLVHHLGSRLGLAAFASTMTLVAALLFTMPAPDLVHQALSGLAALFATFAWLILWGSHFFNRGRALRVRSIVQFFKR